MAYLVLLVALALSAVAAWYSVAGLMVLFAAASLPVAIMASTLEVAKLVTASWLYNNWQRVPFMLKGYLSFSVFVLMFVTSLGIFGFLSKAHLDQAMPVGDIATKIEIIDEKIKAQQTNIDSAKTVLRQMDDAVNQALSRGAGNAAANATAAQQQAATAAAERNTNQAANLRRTQSKERDVQQAIINKAQENIQKLREERAPVAAQMRTLEAEVGPIKYVAEMIWGSDAKGHFDSAVRFLIITLIFVFDPLAVLLVIAANMNMKWDREQKQALTAFPTAVNDQITDSVTQASPDVVNTQITDAVTQVPMDIHAHSVVETKIAAPQPKEAVAKSEPRPFDKPSQPAQMIWPEARVHEMASNIKLNLEKSKVDKAVDESIIDTIDGLPDEELKQVLSKADEETLQQVYARIVEEHREDDPALHRRQGGGAPPGTVPAPRKPKPKV